MNGKRYLKNSNGSEFSIKITLQCNFHKNTFLNNCALLKNKIIWKSCISLEGIEILQKFEPFWIHCLTVNKLCEFCENWPTFNYIVLTVQTRKKHHFLKPVSYSKFFPCFASKREIYHKQVFFIRNCILVFFMHFHCS